MGASGRRRLADTERFLIFLAAVSATFLGAMSLGMQSFTLLLVAIVLLVVAGLAVYLLGLPRSGRNSANRKAGPRRALPPQPNRVRPDYTRPPRPADEAAVFAAPFFTDYVEGALERDVLPARPGPTRDAPAPAKASLDATDPAGHIPHPRDKITQERGARGEGDQREGERPDRVDVSSRSEHASAHPQDIEPHESEEDRQHGK